MKLKCKNLYSDNTKQDNNVRQDSLSVANFNVTIELLTKATQI